MRHPTGRTQGRSIMADLDRLTGYRTENVAVLTMDERDELDEMIATVRRSLTLAPEMVGVYVPDGDAVTDTSAGDA